MELGLGGRGVLVTGGSGGIGSEICRAFAEEGARVAVHWHRNEASARKIADDVGGLAVGGDLRDEAAVDGVVAAAVRGLERLDVCVANAGVWPPADEPVAEMSLARWRETLDSNLTTTFLTARAFLRHVASTGVGSLVMVASTAGVFGEAGHADYAAAKSAIAGGLLLSLKNEVTALGARVRVNAVAPGWTVSPMTSRLLEPERLRRITATMPLRKAAAARDVAAAVVWLASDVTAGHVTGQVVTVAGGMEGRLLHDPGVALEDVDEQQDDEDESDRSATDIHQPPPSVAGP